MCIFLFYEPFKDWYDFQKKLQSKDLAILKKKYLKSTELINGENLLASTFFRSHWQSQSKIFLAAEFSGFCLQWLPTPNLQAPAQSFFWTQNVLGAAANREVEAIGGRSKKKFRGKKVWRSSPVASASQMATAVTSKLRFI